MSITRRSWLNCFPPSVSISSLDTALGDRDLYETFLSVAGIFNVPEPCFDNNRQRCMCLPPNQTNHLYFFFLFITPRKLKLYEMHKVPNSRLPRAFSELSAYRTTCVCESSSNYTALQLWIVTQTHIGTFNMLRFRIYWRISIESNGVFVCSQTDR